MEMETVSISMGKFSISIKMKWESLPFKWKTFLFHSDGGFPFANGNGKPSNVNGKREDGTKGRKIRKGTILRVTFPWGGIGKR